jgi:hypothetical protein
VADKKENPFKGNTGFFPIQVTVSSQCPPVLYSLPYRTKSEHEENPALARRIERIRERRQKQAQPEVITRLDQNASRKQRS